MRTKLAALTALVAAPALHAQWISETIQLDPGWNGIYLHVDASHLSPSELFAGFSPTVLDQVWRWNPELTSTQFVDDPSEPLLNRPEWSLYNHGDGSGDLQRMTGNAAYLVYVSEARTLVVKGRPLVPQLRWSTGGLNFFGFAAETDRSPLSPPNLQEVFGGEMSLILDKDVFQYEGADLNTNPKEVFSLWQTTAERGKAYWIDSNRFSTYAGTIGVKASGGEEGIAFGSESQLGSLRISNPFDGAKTVTLRQVASEAAPAGEVAVAGAVPLLLRTLDPETQQFSYDPLPLDGGQPALTLEIPANESVELVFAVDRSLMTGAVGAVYQSVLQVQDQQKVMRINVGVSAVVGGLEGLWIGEARIQAVDNIISDFVRDQEGGTVFDEEGNPTVNATLTGLRATAQEFPLRLIIHVDAVGNARLLSTVYAGAIGGEPGLTTSEATLDADGLGKAVRVSAGHLPPQGSWDFATAITHAMLRGATPVTTTEVALPFDAATNPFVHAYHPDHDNRAADFETALGDGEESYTVTRAISLDFSDTASSGNDPALGSQLLIGTYSESVSGLKAGTPITCEGPFTLRRLGSFNSLQ